MALLQPPRWSRAYDAFSALTGQQTNRSGQIQQQMALAQEAQQAQQERARRARIAQMIRQQGPGLLGNAQGSQPNMQGLLASEAVRGGDYGGAATLLGMGGSEQPSYVRTAIAMGYDPRTPEGREVIKQLAGSGGVTVNTGAGWAPSGYLPVDPEDPNKGVKPIPGSPAETKRKEQISKQKKREEKEKEEEQFADEALDLSLSLLTPEEAGGHREGLMAASGPVAQWMPTLLGDTATAEQRLQRLKSLLTKENLGLMSGVLSESDIKILEGIGASLELGQQDEDMLGEVGRISAKLAIGRNRLGDLTVEGIKAIAENDSLLDSLTPEQERQLEARMDELGME